MAEPALKSEAPSAEPQDKEQTPLFYTNSLSIAVSFYDLTLLFGYRFGPGRGSGQNLAVTMSPQHAAALRVLLNKYLDKYEGRYGRITLPPDLIEKLNAVDKQPEQPGKDGAE